MRYFMRSELLQNRNFLRLWAAQIGSAFGSRITRTVVPIIAIISLEASTTQVGFLVVLGALPGLFAALFIGGIIDRGSKRKILIIADLVRGVAISVIPIAALFGVLDVTLLYGVVIITGSATAVFQIADNSFLPILVPKQYLVSANSKLEATDSIAEASGPAIAGLLVQIFTAPFAMIIDAASYFWSALMLARIEIVENIATVDSRARGLFADAVAGFKLCIDDPTLRPLLLIGVIGNLFGGFFATLYMVLGLTMLELSPFVLGLVIGVGGFGAFAGAMMAPVLSDKIGVRRAMLVTLISGAISVLLIPASMINPAYGVWFLVAHQVLEDMFMTIFIILALSLRQQIIPKDMLGRANATFQVLDTAMMPVGAILAGPLTVLIGFQKTLWLGAIGGLLAIPVFMFSAVGRKG